MRVRSPKSLSNVLLKVVVGLWTSEDAQSCISRLGRCTSLCVEGQGGFVGHSPEVPYAAALRRRAHLLRPSTPTPRTRVATGMVISILPSKQRPEHARVLAPSCPMQSCRTTHAPRAKRCRMKPLPDGREGMGKRIRRRSQARTLSSLLPTDRARQRPNAHHPATVLCRVLFPQSLVVRII